VADVTGPRARVLGFLPTGWYPVSARVLPDGKLVVLNGRGHDSSPRHDGVDPWRDAIYPHRGPARSALRPEWSGTASIIDAFNEPQLDRYTRTVLENSPYDDRLLRDPDIPPGHPLHPAPGAPMTIQHVVYIVNEGRSYDRVFGALSKGSRDPSLALFPDQVAPNHRKLAAEFVLFDNFYASGATGADGLAWAVSAIAPDYIQRMWPNSYAGRRRTADYEGQEAAAFPPAGYIWTQVMSVGLSMRNYGMFTDLAPLKQVAPGASHVSGVRDQALAPVTNMRYRGFDLDYPDVERARVFLADLAQFEASDNMPRFLILRLGNGHTSGTAPGMPAPAAAFADNDYALGLIVEALSRSKFWAKTAVFVLDAHSSAGSDHVDSHRVPAFILSPFTRRGIVDSTFYNTTSMLRTIEHILRLRPMTIFDASSPVMWSAFAFSPDISPYIAEKPRVRLDERNPGSASATRP
jgi:hypothetical protein